MEQLCTKCKLVKAIDQFSLKRNKPVRICKACHSLYRREHYVKNLEKYKEKARRWERENKLACLHNKLKKFGLSVNEYKQLEIKQNYVCKICGKPPTRGRLCVDHCHKTGKVRALLCSSCNLAVGYVKENYQTALLLADYIKDFQLER